VRDDLGLELGKLLDQYDAKRRAMEDRKRQVKTDEESYRKGFADLRTRVIRPVFEAAGVILKARGHDFSISEDEHTDEPGGRTTEAAITMQVMPAGLEKSLHGDAPFPSLSLVTRDYNKTVCIRSSNGVAKPDGTASPRGDYQLAQVDKALVQAELLKLIAGIVDR
jgi:hypothetical protein